MARSRSLPTDERLGRREPGLACVWEWAVEAKGGEREGEGRSELAVNDCFERA